MCQCNVDQAQQGCWPLFPLLPNVQASYEGDSESWERLEGPAPGTFWGVPRTRLVPEGR